MELSFFISIINSLPANNPAYLDLAKLVVGSIFWFGGLVGFMYWKRNKFKPAVSK